MSVGSIDLTKDWVRRERAGTVSFDFPVPENARGFTPWGFERKNDSAADLYDFQGLDLILRREGFTGPDTLRLRARFAEGESLTYEAPVLFAGGRAEVTAAFEDFPVETARANVWRFVTGFEVETDLGKAEVESLAARRRPAVYLDFPVRGRSGEPGETVNYEGEVYNCLDTPIAVKAEQIFEGWESVKAEIRLEKTQLAPGESCGITVSVSVHDYMAPGGHEDTRIRVRCQGGSDTVTLKTLRRLPHPYLYHDLEGWRKVRENIERYEPYWEPARKLRDDADSWQVRDPMEGRDFCYVLKTEDAVMSAAYLYAISGDAKYARKLLDFFRRFADPVTGYPARKRGCSASYVQEGHFFKHMAAAWDILLGSGLPTEGDKAAMEAVFRLYMDILDVHIRDGHISNWILSELQGALFSALVIGDMDRALRFAFGPGGIEQQFSRGVFNDGWWHECSVGYNTWVSSMMLHVARALAPFGVDITNTSFPVPFNREIDSTCACGGFPVKSAMFNRKWGGSRRPAVRIKDMFDAPLPALDYRGVLFGIADSDEKRLSSVHFGSTYDLAYHYYKDPAYLPIIARNEPDPIFGEPEVHALALASAAPEGVNRPGAFSDNIGLAVVRSRKEGRPPRDQIQAVLRYGSHGGAHGHFDIGDLLSVMRYGRSFFNPEHCWWGYAHFMYKFYVQCSLTKNMVVVDRKMQEPTPSRLICWQEGEKLQSAGVEVRARWSYPPYGGMVYYQDGQSPTKEELRKRAAMNHCFLPIEEGPDSPVYGECTGFTEPITQRRVMAMTDDYIVLFDYLEGETEHCYDSLLQIKGFLGIDGAEYTRHTEQLDPNPISDAQFITDCSWYEAKDGSTAHFRTVFTENEAGEHLRGDRSNWNEPGDLWMDVHTAWPRQTRQMVGRVAVYDGWPADGNGYTIPIAYRLEVDGEERDGGAFDAWILGRGEVSADVRGAKAAVLALRQGESTNELNDPVRTPQGIFWGEIGIELENGEKMDLGALLADGRADFVSTENLDMGFGIGRDYKGGRVTIVGAEYPHSVPASPLDHDRESRIVLDLTGLGAVRITACVGADAFAGDESQRRKTYAVGTRGKAGRFVTVIEPFETQATIRSVTSDGPDSVTVTLKDGRTQTLTLRGMAEGKPKVSLKED